MKAVDVFECFASIPPADVVAVTNVRCQKGFVAKIVDHPRDAEASFSDFFHRTWGELWLAVAACEAEAMKDVELHLGGVERLEIVVDQHALAQLA